MSEEILEQESEEEEIVEEDSSDKKIKAEAKSKASVKKEDGEEAEDDVEESQDFERDSDADMDDATGDEKTIDPEKVKLKAVPAGEAAIPKTKNGMLSAVYEKLNSLKKDELKAKYESILKATSIIVEEDEEEEPAEDVKAKRTKAAIKTEDIHIDVKDDVEALVQGEDGLTEEFKKKASTIFEAAVHAKVVEEVNNKLKEIDGETAKDGETFQKELTEKVDGYLTYVVEEWMSENELAIERGIRSELVEDFMSGLKTLFTEHYIDIPEEKVDMVDDLFTKVEDLETSLDEEINRGVDLQKELAQFKKDDALKQTTKDLADTDSEKIEKLAEGIEFENTEQYIEKLNVLKESYFPKSEAVTSEITETDETIELTEEESPERIDDNMKQYTSAIKRYHN